MGQNNATIDTDYSQLSASVGFDFSFASNFDVGLGGWVAFEIRDENDYYRDNIYKHYFVLSDAYFSYFGDIFYTTLGRYNVNSMGYDWFSGHNQGVSLGFNIGDVATIWGLYSHQQAFQFQRFNRETISQSTALWDFNGHRSQDETSNKEHLGAIGVDFKASDIFRATPYVYYVSDALMASGLSAELTLGTQSKDVYSDTTFKYVYVDEKNVSDAGQLFLIDQEFGYDWFRIGIGYYKTGKKGGASALTRYGDDSRFYGGIVQATYDNKATGEYYGANQSTWYGFIGARHEVFSFDVLYADGDYKEFSALLTITLFKHLNFGVGYVDLERISDNKRQYVTAFFKAIWH